MTTIKGKLTSAALILLDAEKTMSKIFSSSASSRGQHYSSFRLQWSMYSLWCYTYMSANVV